MNHEATKGTKRALEIVRRYAQSKANQGNALSRKARTVGVSPLRALRAFVVHSDRSAFRAGTFGGSKPSTCNVPVSRRNTPSPLPSSGVPGEGVKAVMRRRQPPFGLRWRRQVARRKGRSGVRRRREVVGGCGLVGRGLLRRSLCRRGGSSVGRRREV